VPLAVNESRPDKAPLVHTDHATVFLTRRAARAAIRRDISWSKRDSQKGRNYGRPFTAQEFYLAEVDLPRRHAA
jgi:hypothetical protein